ncbi:hypothetical protein [Neochlamydia sp. S13]|uniref:hypothetical protein n=1 Tax=Neochlamydia sp. S13 TaxID=1353976 RepID=UPI00102E49EE|nr:hypothetical protein [Neochlamydia sp. S13]
MPSISGKDFDALPAAIRTYIRYLEKIIEQQQSQIQQQQAQIQQLQDRISSLEDINSQRTVLIATNLLAVMV